MNQPLLMDSDAPNDPGVDRLQPDQALIFLHLMKTGGTTLFRLLRQNFPQQLTFHYTQEKPGKRLEDLYHLSQAERDRLKFLHGHIHYGFHEQFNQPCRYVSIIRNPINRVVSLYYFIHQNPNRNLPEASRCQTLRDYLDSNPFGIDNDQTRRIAGSISNHYPFGQCDSELLDVAKQNLRKFLVIGVTERFDESLLVLKYALGLEKILYYRFNENSRKPKLEDIDSHDLKRIQHYNQLDTALYQFANELLDEKIQQMGDRFQSEYVFFRNANAQYNQAHTAINKTKAKLRRTRKKMKSARQNRRHLRAELSHGRSSLDSMENSKFWRLWRGLSTCLKR
jgi:hypothetical protein